MKIANILFYMSIISVGLSFNDSQGFWNGNILENNINQTDDSFIHLNESEIEYKESELLKKLKKIDSLLKSNKITIENKYGTNSNKIFQIFNKKIVSNHKKHIEDMQFSEIDQISKILKNLEDYLAKFKEDVKSSNYAGLAQSASKIFGSYTPNLTDIGQLSIATENFKYFYEKIKLEMTKLFPADIYKKDKADVTRINELIKLIKKDSILKNIKGLESKLNSLLLEKFLTKKAIEGFKTFLSSEINKTKDIYSINHLNLLINCIDFTLEKPIEDSKSNSERIGNLIDYANKIEFYLVEFLKEIIDLADESKNNVLILEKRNEVISNFEKIGMKIENTNISGSILNILIKDGTKGDVCNIQQSFATKIKIPCLEMYKSFSRVINEIDCSKSEDEIKNSVKTFANEINNLKAMCDKLSELPLVRFINVKFHEIKKSKLFDSTNQVTEKMFNVVVDYLKKQSEQPIKNHFDFLKKYPQVKNNCFFKSKSFKDKNENVTIIENFIELEGVSDEAKRNDECMKKKYKQKNDYLSNKMTLDKNENGFKNEKEVGFLNGIGSYWPFKSSKK